jgi:hypothetical protein
MTVATEPASSQTKATTSGMKALVYHGPGKRAWEETPRPAIQNTTGHHRPDHHHHHLWH